MHAIDTNVLVRLITRDHPLQVQEAEAFVQRGAWISHLVLAETMWVLSAVYEVGPESMATAIDMLLDHENLVIQDRSTVAAAQARFRKQPNLGFSDCLILEIATAAGHLPLGTLDRKLSQLDGAQRI